MKSTLLKVIFKFCTTSKKWSSLLLLAFARVNPKLKKLQHRARTTYWLYALIICIIGSISVGGLHYRQACSQDLEKGGGFFERVKKVQTTLTRILIVLESVTHGLSENSDEISRKARKFEGFFRPKSVGLQKKKKKVFAEIESDFSAEIQHLNVFFAQNQVVSKKKKRSSPKLSLIFRPNSEIQTFQGGCFLMGGAIFNFSQKIGLKSIKNVRFWILHKPMGGLEPPPAPPGYATDYRLCHSIKFIITLSEGLGLQLLAQNFSIFQRFCACVVKNLNCGALGPGLLVIS